MGHTVKKLIVVLASAALLAACSSNTTDDTSTEGSASVELTTWAGQVCADISALRTSITDIGGAVTTGGSNLQTNLASQFSLIQTSAQSLLTTVGDIPAAASDSPGALAIKQTSSELHSSVAELGTSVDALADASGIGLATALVSVGTAASAAGQAALDSVSAINMAIQDRSASIGSAFAASPACTELTKQSSQ